MQEVVKILVAAGFSIDSDDNDRLASQLASPVLLPTDDGISVLESDVPLDLGGTVMTRTRSSTDGSLKPLSAALRQMHTSETVAESPEPSSINSGNTLHDLTPEQRTTRSKSHSPASGEVIALAPVLTTIGLKNEDFELWQIKLIKLIAFPDTIPGSSIPGVSLTYDHLAQVPEAPARGRNPFASSPSGDETTSSEEDGYFSHSPTGNVSTSSFTSSASYPDVSKPPSMPASFKPVSRRSNAPQSPLDGPGRNASHDPLHKRHVAFWSFTRTLEGVSLTSDVTLLTALFPPEQRHMVSCSGELDALDAANGDLSQMEDDDDIDGESNMLRCLQIDLQRFGLDKHGLVNRFSRVLEEAGINHMYSSTFKTANVLVDRRHALRAQELLCSC